MPNENNHDRLSATLTSSRFGSAIDECSRAIPEEQAGTRCRPASFPPQLFVEENNMTYEDPQSGRERNLGQDDTGSSMGSLIAGIIFVAAIAFGGWYFYNQSQKVADNSSKPPVSSAQSSGPGVQGNSGSTNGPAANNSSTGASSGNTGVGGDNTSIDKTTPPSQDATGVKGAEGGTNGPAANAPSPSNTPSNNPSPQPSTNP
jgi:cytoskeletal protein RodZ